MAGRQDAARTLRIRVDADDAQPPARRHVDLRRQLDLPSDMTLDLVHQVLQATFGWDDSHLHRFAVGGRPFAGARQEFLCPFDVEEGDPDDADGVPASGVRLDDVLHAPGDVLHYLYDYGESWQLSLRLEEVLPAQPRTMSGVDERLHPLVDRLQGTVVGEDLDPRA